MPKPIITINGFEHGILNDKTIPATNGFSFGAGIDIHAEEGVLQASQRLVKDEESTADPGDIRTLPYWMQHYEQLGANNADVWALTADSTGGRIYAKSSNKWHLVHNTTLTTGRGGFKSIGSTLYYSSDVYLGRTLPTTLAADDTSGSLSLKLNSTHNLPGAGDVVVGKTVISYTSVNPNRYLLGLTRPAFGTTDADHTSGDVVIGFHDTFQVLKAQDNLYHPIESYIGKVCVGDGRYIATWNEKTWDDDALTLAEGYRISTLKVFGDDLNIGTYQGTNFHSFPGRLFTWNGVSGLPEETQALQEGISAMDIWKGNLILFAGAKGNIYSYNGASIEKLKTVPEIELDALATVYPGATSIVEGNLLFGVSGTRIRTVTNNAGMIPGIYSLGQKDSSKPIALTLKHITSSGLLERSTGKVLDIGSILPYGYNQFYVGQSDDASSNANYQYKIDYLDTATKIISGVNTSAAIYDTQIYEIPRDNQSRLLKGAETIMNNTDGTVNIKYKLDGASTWTTLGETDYQNQFLRGIDQRAKQIQLRLELEPNGNVSPQIKMIRIF